MAKISGQVVLEPRVVIPLGFGSVNGKLKIKYPEASLSVYIYVGNDGDGSVGPNTGYALSMYETIEFDYIERLENIYLYLDIDPSMTIPEYLPYRICWIIYGEREK